MTEKKEKWWKNAVIYQIYPKSFQDSDGDGVGDIRGIIQRLDYLEDLGIDAVWISPMYCSRRTTMDMISQIIRILTPCSGRLQIWMN